VANAGVAPSAPRSAGAVPWSSVGTGWVLAEYSAGTVAKPAATTLELGSPGGARYPLYTWAKSATPVPTLVAWSPSKTEALFMVWSKNYQPNGVLDRLNLLTGKITTIKLARTTRIVSYTLPTGLQLLADEISTTPTTWTETIERLSKTGQPVKTVVSAKYSVNAVMEMAPVYAPDGASVAVTASGGVGVVSNAGGAVKQLPIPGGSKKYGCPVARWWNSTTILSLCAGRLWLVPANGAKPKALTPVRGTVESGGNIDLGDFEAWQLPSGLYLNSLAACGSVVVNKQNANGSVTTLHITGLDDPHVLSAAGPRLLIDSSNCGGGPNNPGDTVAWYNPATKAKTVVFATGVREILPFPNVADEANFF
jgi:TolB protein